MFYIDFQLERFKLVYGDIFQVKNDCYKFVLEPSIKLPLKDTCSGEIRMIRAKELIEYNANKSYLVANIFRPSLVKNVNYDNFNLTDAVKFLLIDLDKLYCKNLRTYLTWGIQPTSEQRGYYAWKNCMFFDGNVIGARLLSMTDGVIYIGSNGEDLITRNVLSINTSPWDSYSKIRFKVFKKGNLVNSITMKISDIYNYSEAEKQSILSLLEG